MISSSLQLDVGTVALLLGIPAVVIIAGLIVNNLKWRRCYKEAVSTVSLGAGWSHLTDAMAHELNNPLAIIDGRTKQLEKCLEGNTADLAKARRYCGEISKATERIVKSTKALKSIICSSIEPGYLETILIDELIADIVLFSGRGSEKRPLQIEFDTEEPALEVECRPHQICQMILSVLSYISQQIDRTPEEKRDLRVRLSLKLNSDQAKLVFVYFRVAETTGAGRWRIGTQHDLGLGLPKKLVQDHGGKLVVFDRGDQAVIEVDIPLIARGRHVKSA